MTISAKAYNRTLNFGLNSILKEGLNTVPLKLSPAGHVRYEVGHILTGETWDYHDVNVRSVQACIDAENRYQWHWANRLKSRRLGPNSIRVWR